MQPSQSIPGPKERSGSSKADKLPQSSEVGCSELDKAMIFYEHFSDKDNKLVDMLNMYINICIIV